MSCIGQPISWLALERYQLGELGGGEARAVEAHLQACPACARCHAELEQPLALPPLPAPAPLPAPRPRRAFWQGLRFWLPLGSAAAAAAVALLVMLPSTPALPGPRVGVKGGDLVLTLVRERDGSIALDPGRFAARDRFKVQLTCPPGRVHWDVVVYQDGVVSFPLAAGQAHCGNRVTLPGAFHLDGDAAADVCVVLADSSPSARAKLSRGPQALPASAACQRVRPAR